LLTTVSGLILIIKNMEEKAKEQAKKLFNDMIYSENKHFKKKDAISILNDKIKFLKLVKKEVSLF
jgi:hypothetical protein